MLYSHQIDAIETVERTDFSSGVLDYATGTGKSRIGYEIVNRFNNKYPRKSIIWVCEHKFILKENFNKNYFINRTLSIVNYSDNIKPSDWPHLINSTRFWGKPIMLVINRAFLTYKNKYEKLNLDFGLIIHDECHTINSSTTQNFYSWLLNKYSDIKSIGLSATPNISIKPYTQIIKSFNLIDGIINDIIVSPHIYHLKSNETISLDDKFKIIKYLIDKSLNKKIIIWCGTINNCEYIYNEWQYRNTYNVLKCYRSHSHIDEIEQNKFARKENNAILFCANKHHEASDFYNLDGCVFIDGVKIRTNKLFVQCLGRIIRKSKNKKFGWILDIDAKNSLHLCNSLMSFIEKNDEKWSIKSEKEMINNIELNKISFQINEYGVNVEVKQVSNIENLNKDNIFNYFKRECPENNEYKNRLNYEIKMIDDKNLFNILNKAIKIQEICKDYLHITRGSCGSSLLCYLLGITHVDPIKYNISFVRFLHEGRNELPDIDFDFSHKIRDDVFMKINDELDDKIARISSIINWQERSATREAIRKMGYNNKYSNDELKCLIKRFSKDEIDKMNEISKNLIGTYRTSMPHVGGIVFNYGDNMNSKSKHMVIDILKESKRSISDKKIFKIDILSSRGLSIIKDASIKITNEDFIHIKHCNKTIELFANGNNIGLVLAESVLMKRAFMRYKPKTIEEVAYCLAIVRPMAKLSREYRDETNINIVYDDDVIKFVQNTMNCTEYEADNIRRLIQKGDIRTIQMFVNKLEQIVYPNNIQKYVQLLNRITEYGFCKAHAISYAMMVWHLAYIKANDPINFWKAVYNNADSAYKPWVHMYECVIAGVDVRDEKLCKNDISIYAKTRQCGIGLKKDSMNEYEQMREFGYWSGLFDGDFFPGCYFEEETNETGIQTFRFCGIIAAYRTPRELKKQNKMGFYLGISSGKYLDIIIPSIPFNKNIIGIKGRCSYLSVEENIMIGIDRCEEF